jgi:hypothetical protein
VVLLLRQFSAEPTILRPTVAVYFKLLEIRATRAQLHHFYRLHLAPFIHVRRYAPSECFPIALRPAYDGAGVSWPSHSPSNYRSV